MIEERGNRDDQHGEDEDDLDDELGGRIRALPREIGAPRDLWRGIEARIESKRRRVVVLRRSVTAGAMLLAAAAVILAVRTPAAPIATHPVPSPVTSLAVAVPPVPAAAEGTSPELLVPEEAAYVAALAGLESAFHDRRKSLPAKDASRVEASLRAIDVAIATTRASLADHPADPDLRAELDAEYEQKIDAMNDVLEWTTRS